MFYILYSGALWSVEIHLHCPATGWMRRKRSPGWHSKDHSKLSMHLCSLSWPMRGQYPGYEIILDQSEASFRSCDLSPPPPNISPLKVINASLLSPDQHCCCYHWLNTLWKQTSARYQLLCDTLSDHFPACIIKMSSQDVKRTTEVFV